MSPKTLGEGAVPDEEGGGYEEDAEGEDVGGVDDGEHCDRHQEDSASQCEYPVMMFMTRMNIMMPLMAIAQL